MLLMYQFCMYNQQHTHVHLYKGIVLALSLSLTHILLPTFSHSDVPPALDESTVVMTTVVSVVVVVVVVVTAAPSITETEAEREDKKISQLPFNTFEHLMCIIMILFNIVYLYVIIVQPSV